MLASLLLAFSGCIPRPGGDDKPSRSGDVETIDDGIDYEKDKFIVPERTPERAETASGAGGSQLDWATIDSLRRLNPEIDSVTTLYRVQLFASQYFSEAGFEKEIAEEMFDEPIYLVYEVPYYKLLAGNCTELSAGERLLRRVRSLGYENGWLVQSAPDSIYYESLMPPDSLVIIDTTSSFENTDY